MSPADDHFPSMWKQESDDPEKKKLERRLDNITNTIILILVVIGLLLGGDMNLGLILIVVCLIAVSVTAKFVIKQVFNHSHPTIQNTEAEMRISLDEARIPFLPDMIKDKTNADDVGIYGVFNLRTGKDGSEHLIPIYWDYGNIREGLLKLLHVTEISIHVPRYCGYKVNPANHEEVLKALREEEPKPLCAGL